MKETYIQYGVPSDWADQFELKGISASTFRNTSKKNLIEVYKIPENKVEFVKDCLTRKPIDDKVVQELLENSAYLCCLCYGKKSTAYIIHHIIEYSVSRDNSYDNLAVVCLDDHDLAHRKGIALTNKISEAQVRESKKRWEIEVKESKGEKIKSSLSKNSKLDWKNANPYKELQSYTEIDRDVFFGREKEMNELVASIYKHNIVGLFGESGTGKTSLVNAGVIPKLKDEGVVVVSTRCLDEPIKRIREALVRTSKENKFAIQSIEELASIDSFPHLIIQLKTIADREKIKLAIIIDQFEELFTRAKELERSQLAKGILEALITPTIKGKVYFLLSLREDYIGDLWEWSHKYSLEVAWVQQYRIKRLNDEKAYEVITEPLKQLGIKINDEFILQLVSELNAIGVGAIYPPYVQIICSILFEKYKAQNPDEAPFLLFDHSLYDGASNAESIIAGYLSESMLEGLTEEEKNYAQSILDLLTGPEGLRTFLTIDEIARYIGTDPEKAGYITEHLIKKKIVHPVTENDAVKGYELVHDFLSKKFFEKLSPEAKKLKTTLELFRIAFKEWKQHEVLASKGRLDILAKNISQLTLTEEEWLFIVKSSFSVYWWYTGNEWVDIVEKDILAKICLKLLKDSETRIVENSIKTLAKIKENEYTETFKEIFESSTSSDSLKITAISVFCNDVIDINILEPLKAIIRKNQNPKLRKEAVIALAINIERLSKSNSEVIDKEIDVIYEVLNDSKTEVRKQAADMLGYYLIDKKSVVPLIKRLEIESSFSSRKSMVYALGVLMRRRGESINVITTIMNNIISDDKEDYRVRNEAKLVVQNGYDRLSVQPQ